MRGRGRMVDPSWQKKGESMTLDDLINSYDSVDTAYRRHFAEHRAPAGSRSFIPGRKELEKIFFFCKKKKDDCGTDIPRRCPCRHGGEKEPYI